MAPLTAKIYLSPANYDIERAVAICLEATEAATVAAVGRPTEMTVKSRAGRPFIWPFEEN